MIIDSHTHVDTVGWYDPPETIISLMDEAGIDKAIIMTYVDAPDTEGALEYIAESVDRYPDRLIGYARMNPRQGDAALSLFQKAMEEYRFKGLKLHPVSTLLHPGGAETVQMIRLAAQYNAPTLFHCGDEEMTLPLQVARAAEACPDATIILGHSGGYFHVADAIRVAEEFPNVVLDTSAMPYPGLIREAVNRIGADRVIYASDGPGCDPSLEVHKVRLARLTAEEEERVFYRNIKTILDRVSHTTVGDGDS
ncbi:MAG: amidohydrolase family protein [Bacillota bacterium]